VSTLDNSKTNVLVADNNVSELKNESAVLDSNITIEGGLAQSKAVDTNRLDSVSVAKQINYLIKNPSAIVGNPQQLQKIMRYHSKGKQWLESLNQKYVIQLSTRHIRSIDATLRFHKQNKLSSDSIHIIVDYNKNINKYRLKVFYMASSSFSGMSQEIDNLPDKFKNASPYIATVEQLVQNLRYTDKKLQEIGILNE
ncbi:MAG: hypothetical protein U9N57_06020, partial [Pseudomonadota bacterium]|nr:hypothetical protein [Pseudomonadota bacterium]